MPSLSSGPGRAGFARCFALIILIPLAAGCASRKVKVSGRVLYNGDPLPGGILTFRPADPAQNSVSAVLDPEGKYEAVLPVGEIKVCIDNRELAPRPAARAPRVDFIPADVRKKLANAGAAPAVSTNNGSKREGTYKPIPGKYYEIENSGLHFTASPSDAKHDFVLSK